MTNFNNMEKLIVYFLLISVYTVYVGAEITSKESCEYDGNNLKCINKSLSSLNYILIDYIESVNIAYNQFEQLPKLYYDNGDQRYNTIQKWNMTHNKFQELILDQRMKYVVELDVSYNSISSIQLSTKMNSLKYLDLSNNPLSRIGFFRTNFNSLEFLDLSSTHLTRTGNLTDLRNLKKLRLSNNINLNYNSNLNFTKLIELDLSNCNLPYFNSSLLNNIIFLNLSHNIINETFFDGLGNIKELDLSFNKINSLPRQENCLEKLYLENNPIREFTYIVGSKLISLDVSSCQISQIYKESLNEMPSLWALNLANNKITALPDDIASDSLYKLDISSCRIKSINNKTFRYLTNLHQLNMKDNLLTTAELIYFPKRLTQLELVENPFTCNCNKLRNMYDWMYSMDHNVQATCEFPEKNIKLGWLDACTSEWTEEEYGNHDHLWMYSVGIITAMFTLLFVFILVRKIKKYREDRAEQERDEARRVEEREALRRMERLQREQIEEADYNAPDPRELQRPPSYHEALLLPPLDASHPSLAGSLNSLASRRSNRSMHASNPDISKKGRVRRKRRRRKSDSYEPNRGSRIVIDSEDTSGTEISPPRREALESDF